LLLTVPRTEEEELAVSSATGRR